MISIFGMATLGLSFYGLSRLTVSTKFGDMFHEDSQTNLDMVWLEQHLGPISSVEILLRFGTDSNIDLLDRIRCIRRVMEHLVTKPEVGGVFSATHFLPDWSESKSIAAVARRSAVRKSVEAHLPELIGKGFVAEAEDGQVWRITAKVSALAGEDYGVLTKKISLATQEITDVFQQSHDLQTEFTGLTPVMHETQITILNDLGFSFATAFLMITPVMMIVGRGFFTGLLLMVPNVLPVTLVFGLMGWLGFPLDIAGILTASVALGIAVDDTLHFTSWYLRELSHVTDHEVAIANTMHSCALAMMHTTAISCCSMAPFLLAEFNPTRQFATLMISMLTGAILGDLILLPALLLSPVGRRWCKRVRSDPIGRL